MFLSNIKRNILNFVFQNWEHMSLYILPLAMGPWQIVLIVLAILLLWGGKKIPELMKGLGGGIKEFKKASREDDDPQKEIEDK